jgi:hypothetical protein
MARHVFTPTPQVAADQPEDPVRRYTAIDPAQTLFDLVRAVNRLEQRVAALEQRKE